MDTTTPHSLEPQPTASALPSAPLNTTHHNLETPPRTIYSDRFIPSRSSSNFALFNLSPHPCNSYNTLLRAALFGPDSCTLLPPLTPEKLAHNNYRYLQCSPPNSNIFKFKTETKRSLQSLSPFAFDDQLPGICPAPVKAPRKVPRSPYKILHAPGLQDNFYLNLVDWSSQNVLAVGLGNCVYLWHASISKVVKLCDLRIDDSVCSVGWTQRGSHLAVGTRNGKLQIWDASCCKRIRIMEGHGLQVGALAWSSSLLSSGSWDKSILLRDI